MNVEILIIVLLVLIIVGYFFTYIMKTRHYRAIDELDQKKRELTQRSLNEQFQRGDQLTLSGQSEEEFKKLLQKWNEVETRQFPSIENYLFEAEKSADLLRFSKAKDAEEKAGNTLSSITENIDKIRKDLERLFQHEAENQKRVENTQKRYQNLRKKLLTQSFSFGPALEELENRLSEMEGQFTTFSEKTTVGDHVEAKEVLEQLEKEINSMENQLEMIPEELEVLDTVFPEEIEDLKNGYEELRSRDIKFPDDTILTDIHSLEEQILISKQLIGELALEEAEDKIEKIDESIEALYNKMETEIQAKQAVRKDATDIRRGFHYLLEQNRRLRIETDRISQSYVLDVEEAEAGERLQDELETNQKQFAQLQEEIANDPMVFSDVQRQFQETFDELERINEEQESINEELLGLRAKELQIKQHVDEMENRMRTLKRQVEMHHLPGLPEQYLDLFFYVTDRIEELTNELGRIRMDMKKAQELEQLCEEEVQKIEKQTGQLLTDVQLTELVMQYISRYRSEHPSIEEAVLESRKLFGEEYDYHTALETLVAELEKAEPGAYEKIKTRYFEKQETT